MIYNHLFFHAHNISLKRKDNFMPYVLSITVVTICFMFHIASIFFILEKHEIVPFIFKKEYKWFFPLVFIGLVSFYYLHGEKYKNIYSNYRKANGDQKLSKSILIVFLYYLSSFLLLIFSAMYKNQNYIFE